eukprot:snap_masked-scaffold_11-processed-gene-4.20-mRNA-1 protein AED:1.00 eAED:1.00 QI:0/-1/0/0/-1/1/1/0/291
MIEENASKIIENFFQIEDGKVGISSDTFDKNPPFHLHDKYRVGETSFSKFSDPKILRTEEIKVIKNFEDEMKVIEAELNKPSEFKSDYFSSFKILKFQSPGNENFEVSNTENEIKPNLEVEVDENSFQLDDISLPEKENISLNSRECHIKLDSIKLNLDLNLRTPESQPKSSNLSSQENTTNFKDAPDTTTRKPKTSNLKSSSSIFSHFSGKSFGSKSSFLSLKMFKKKSKQNISETPKTLLPVINKEVKEEEVPKSPTTPQKKQIISPNESLGPNLQELIAMQRKNLRKV